MDILLRNGTIVPMDGKNRSLRGSVLIRENRIAGIGEIKERADVEIDCSHKIIMPGLIDTHMHLAQALLRGCADDLPLVRWLNERVWPMQSTYDEELGSLSAELCIAEMLLSGTTTFLESGLHRKYGIEGIAEVTERSGIRGFLSKMLMDQAYYADHAMYEGMVEDRDAAMAEAMHLFHGWNGKAEGRIRVALAARTPGACTPELYREMSEKAEELKTVATLHFCEIREDVDFIRREYGMSPIEFLEHCGLNRSDIILAHGVWLGEEDIGSLKANVAHCPSSNLKLGSGIAGIEDMLNAGVNVSLGCDGAPCNNTYDLFRDVWLSALLQKGKMLDATVMSAERALSAATVNGAKALGINAGSIEEGKLADVITIDTKRPHMMPVRDPLSSVVYCVKGSDVCDVIVNGDLVVEEHELRTIDVESLLERVNEKGLLPDRKLHFL